ncbi:MAG: ribonuclease HII [Bacteroidota bacterium]|nr:ribonuclease HII [Bacteroidota bacterium]
MKHIKESLTALTYERELWQTGKRFVAGVDEAGRGPLAGPVVAAAVVFPRELVIDGIKDSKTLSEKKRTDLFEQIHLKALSIGVGIVDHALIDEINVLNATFKAMHKAIGELEPAPEHLLVDGPYFVELNIPALKIVDGDSKCFTIAAASIIAKVIRDNMMIEYDKLYPQYGFAKHKGYGTEEHIEAIRKYGFCEIHRKSFKIRSLNSE